MGDNYPYNDRFEILYSFTRTFTVATCPFANWSFIIYIPAPAGMVTCMEG